MYIYHAPSDYIIHMIFVMKLKVYHNRELYKNPIIKTNYKKIFFSKMSYYPEAKTTT